MVKINMEAPKRKTRTKRTAHFSITIEADYTFDDEFMQYNGFTGAPTVAEWDDETLARHVMHALDCESTVGLTYGLIQEWELLEDKSAVATVDVEWKK